MAYQTIRDLTDNVRRLHRHLRTLIDEARSREDDERSKLLLDFIDQHESALEHAIDVAERREDGAVLDTWLQYEPNVEVERALKRGELDSTATEEIVALVIETENSIIRLYELVQGAHSSPSVQSFFASLLEMEASGVRRSALAELESEDV